MALLRLWTLDSCLCELLLLLHLSRLSGISAAFAHGLEVFHLHKARSLATMDAAVALSLSAFHRPHVCKRKHALKQRCNKVGPLKLQQAFGERRLMVKYAPSERGSKAESPTKSLP